MLRWSNVRPLKIWNRIIPQNVLILKSIGHKWSCLQGRLTHRGFSKVTARWPMDRATITSQLQVCSTTAKAVALGPLQPMAVTFNRETPIMKLNTWLLGIRHELPHTLYWRKNNPLSFHSTYSVPSNWFYRLWTTKVNHREWIIDDFLNGIPQAIKIHACSSTMLFNNALPSYLRCTRWPFNTI